MKYLENEFDFHQNWTDVAYYNSYRLLVGKATYEDLSIDGEFILPTNHEDPMETIKYFESIEDYEKCGEILKCK
jgi:hypothetical protein